MTALPTTSPIAPPTRQVRAITALLWASAAVLSLLIVVQSVSLLGAQPLDLNTASASAGTVVGSGQFVLLEGEIGKDNLIISLDNVRESIAVYRLDSASQPQLYQQLSLPRIFIEAQARGPGRR